MRTVGVIFSSVLILQASRLAGAIGGIHPWSFASLVALGLLFWKLRPVWAAPIVWILAVVAGSLAAAIFNIYFPDPKEGGALVWWPLIGFLLYRREALRLVALKNGASPT